ncbi:MAG: tRNA guanosine(34) transglycosylase Tgt [Anaerolineales bacterium]|nr:tRNA guanosine(34) transglycosylase Tgt [Anaerolineales bacterium]
MKHTHSLKLLSLPHGDFLYPVFLPDATSGVVRSLNSADLEEIGIQALVMNTFHLMQKPGSSTIQALGGLHQMTSWENPILTDSGGFQAYSVIRENPKNGSLSDKGIFFFREGDKRKFQLTPEKTIQLQINYDSDVVICLDDCTHVDDDFLVQEKAVERTVAWAKRCKTEFSRLTEKIEPGSRPVIFAVVQGGGSLELRNRCAEQLLEIGFDGYGFGGWPLDSEGNLLEDILCYTRSLIPDEFPMHALGVGHPESIQMCYQMGYQIFDCALPTRDARRGRLFTFTDIPSVQGDWFKYLYIADDKFIKDTRPISETCDCPTCQRYSRGYLHHLFKISETAYYRLATIHNLRFMVQLENLLRNTM